MIVHLAPKLCGWLPLRRESARFAASVLPILPAPDAAPDSASAANKARHKRMVHLVEQLLSLQKQLAAAKTPQEQTVLQRQIDATDRQIDRLVYELYGLTDEEI